MDLHAYTGSLRWKLLAASVTIVLVMLSLLLFYTSRLIDGMIEKQSQTYVNEVLPLLNETLGPLLFRRDFANAEGVLKNLVSSNAGGIQYLVLLDPQSRLFAHAGAVKPDALPVPAALPDGSDRLFHGRLALRMGQAAVGELRYGLSFAEITRVRGDLWAVGIAVGVVTLILTIIAFALAAHFLTRHLEHLVSAVRAIAGGDYRARVEIESDDEIGRLARHFNQMIDAVREREARLRALTNLSADWYWEQDENFRFKDISDAGLSPNLHARSPVGKRRWELEADNLTAAQWQVHRAQLERHEPFYNFEFQRIAEDGQNRWVSVSGEPVFAPDGRFTGYRGVGRDITISKQADAALRASEARFRSIFEQAPVGMALTELDGTRIAVNAAYCGMTGYTEQELLAGAEVNHPDDRGMALARKRRMAAGEVASYQTEKRYLRKDGAVVWGGFWATVMRDQQGRTIRLIIVQDITARKQAESELARLNADLERRVAERTAELAEANEELETFAYSVAHDLKAPLRGIDGYSRLLIEDYADRLDDEGRRFLDNLRRAAVNMSELIEDLLGYSRIERGGRTAERLDLQLLVREVVDDVGARGNAAAATLINNCPPLQALADREGLTIALRNLVDNALKFSGRAERPVVEVGGRENERSCILWVRDNGMGFDMKFHDRIFGIFERLNRTEEFPGTGVGLAIVRKAMERMGGRVWAESTPGEGAVFYLEVPK